MLYLPQLREEVDKIAKNPKAIAVCIVLCLAVACAGGWLLCRHYEHDAAADSHDTTVTIQSIADDNHTARDDIDAAAGQIDAAEEQFDGATTALDRSTESATRLQNSVAGNSAQLDECQDIIASGRSNIAEARQIFADVDNANQINGAQAGSH